jgi:hypothetical protein
MGAKLNQNGIFKPMKWMIFVMFLIVGGITTAQPKTFYVKFLKDYYYYPAEGQPPLKKGANCFVLTNKKDMKRMFGETNRVDTPDFSKEWMLVFVMPKAKWHNKVDIMEEARMMGTTIMVYCKMEQSNKKLTYEYNPIKVCTIPIFNHINTVVFHADEHMRIFGSVRVK